MSNFDLQLQWMTTTTVTKRDWWWMKRPGEEVNVVINRSRFEEETLAACLITSLVIVRKLLKISLLGLHHPAAPSTQHHPLHGLMEPLTERRANTCSICMMVTITNKSSAPPLRGAAGLVCIGSSPSSRRHHLSQAVKKSWIFGVWFS